jgi:hypothetical protein
MNRRIIAKEWERYRDTVIPKGAPRVQVVETERAFHAGAWALLNKIVNMLSDGDETTAADVQLVEDVNEELKTFFARVVVDGAQKA